MRDHPGTAKDLAHAVRWLLRVTFIGGCIAAISNVTDDQSNDELYTMLCIALALISLIGLFINRRRPDHALSLLIWTGLSVHATMLWIDVTRNPGPIPPLVYLPVFGSLAFVVLLDRSKAVTYTSVYVLELIPIGIAYRDWGAVGVAAFGASFLMLLGLYIVNRYDALVAENQSLRRERDLLLRARIKDN